MSTVIKDMDKKLEPDHEILDAVDFSNRKILVIFLRSILEKRESSYAQVRLFAWKN